MKIEKIDCYKLNIYSKIIEKYINNDTKLSPFYRDAPSIENFEKTIKEKTFCAKKRNELVIHLKEQYSQLVYSDNVKKNIALLENKNTYTVTTGHQLNLFSGPLYFIYKIISTLNLAKQLNDKYQQYRFIPIYWMASEDHDFEEIRFFNYNGKKFQWNKKHSKGAVGTLNTEGLDTVFKKLDSELKDSLFYKEVKNLYAECYLKSETLSEATLKFVNQLFGEYGLIILDANSKRLKKSLIPYLKEEITQKTSYTEVTKTIASLKNIFPDYKPTVNPREINLFYLENNSRNRIIYSNGEYLIENLNKTFTENELLNEIDSTPEKFSPNVIFRPLYQEIILPNICYIGGGGEIAYWLQLKSFFNSQKIDFPLLLLRNSVLMMPQKSLKKIDKVGIQISDLFLNKSLLIDKITHNISDIKIDFSDFKLQLQKQFEKLYDTATKTDASFLGSVKAQEVKQNKGIDVLEKRLLKAQKRKLEAQINSIISIQNELFPNNSLQERTINFTTFYEKMGDDFIKELMYNLDPLESKFTIFIY